MIEVKITRMCGTEIGIFQAGDIARLPDALARDLVDVHKAAEYVTVTQQVEQPANPKRRKVTK